MARPLAPAFLAALGALAGTGVAPAATTEVVVTLKAPPLASAARESRALTTSARARRLDVRGSFARGYLARLSARQDAVASRIERLVPGAHVRWRYGVVLNGLAVALPTAQVDRLRRVAGVVSVQPGIRLLGRLDRSTAQIGAPLLWGPTFSTAGQGVKIAILDDGLDASHPFFNPAGYTFPPGFPKGQTAFTSAKVIVARAFPPRSPAYKFASRPFDPELSGHGEHVAGIAAGNHGAVAGTSGRILSGVAPAAYLGNYKAFTIPTESGVGPNGNSPEFAAAIEAAVKDGMDVINLSVGQAPIAADRDVFAKAITGATKAGVVVVVSAGNEFGELGAGSIGTPAATPSAITVAAVTKANEIAGFSSGGPSPLTLGFKPDLAAPGVGILSSVPTTDGAWDSLSGTSMSAPHIAGAAALLLQRNPDWTPAQVKSALVQTAEPLPGISTMRQGGGLAQLGRAITPLLFAAPTAVTFGELRPAATRSTSVVLTDAGGGAGTWNVVADVREGAGRVALTLPATVEVPGTLAVTARAADEGDTSGYIVLERAGERRRIPFWALVARPRLGPPAAVLTRTGTFTGDTRNRAARVSRYRYPDVQAASAFATTLAGPELVLRVRLRRPVANFGVAVVSQSARASIEPRIVAAGNENRLMGYTTLPLNHNPYLPDFLDPRRASGVVLPDPGLYDIVFDSATRAQAGRFRFRFWIDDSTPPTLRLLGRRGSNLVVVARDAGSGIDPDSLRVTIDGGTARAQLAGDRLLLPLGTVARGRHRLVIRASDYQESRNMEDVSRILPNTRELRTTFTR